ncbi:hypothetical protein [Lignipirellula cremea]|uniref:Uncharacterized protein n=1 Tax=Lignipirellula cremea TaxID=2528010 RepID=A0A518DQG9_9BACT|nr:hypothetical protein [Lignipirellula cremea]QDU94090.1 hypothetical protein Pla8534_18760 [Lignipirellula cremea]
MHVAIIKPKPEQNQWNYSVVYIADDLTTEVHEVPTSLEAEAIAAELAEKHGCEWNYLRDFPELPHWFDENGHMRNIDRLEIVHLGAGRGQFNCFSGSVRLTVDMGEIGDLLEYLLILTGDWTQPGSSSSEG